VFEDEVTYDHNTKHFRGNMNVYVTLTFGEPDASLSEAFPAQFSGHVVNSKPVIDDVTIDTHTFFE